MLIIQIDQAGTCHPERESMSMHNPEQEKACSLDCVQEHVHVARRGRERAHDPVRMHIHNQKQVHVHIPERAHITQRDHARVYIQPRRQSEYPKGAGPKWVHNAERVHNQQCTKRHRAYTPERACANTDRERITHGRESTRPRVSVWEHVTHRASVQSREHLNSQRECNPEKGCKTQREHTSVQSREYKMKRERSMQSRERARVCTPQGLTETESVGMQDRAKQRKSKSACDPEWANMRSCPRNHNTVYTKQNEPVHMTEFQTESNRKKDQHRLRHCSKERVHDNARDRERRCDW